MPDVTLLGVSPVGPRGPQGPKGDQGDSIVGPQGPQGPIGPTGPPGGTASFRGTWAAGTPYATFDVVSHQGSSYFAIAPSTGVTPGTDATKWQLAAQRGTDGAAGPQGAQGPQGQAGTQGPGGVAGATGPQGPAPTNALYLADQSPTTGWPTRPATAGIVLWRGISAPPGMLPGDLFLAVSVYPTAADITAPATPTGFSAVPGNNQVALGWNTAPEGDFARWNLYRDSVFVAAIGAGQPRAYTDTTVSNGTAYTYTLTAVDTSGNESTGVALTATPTSGPDLVAPAVPTGLAAVAGLTTVSISWNSNTETDLKDYRLYVSIDAGAYSLLATITQPTHAYTHAGVSAGHSYTYKITARDLSLNESAASSTVTVTPAAGISLPTVSAAPVGFYDPSSLVLADGTPVASFTDQSPAGLHLVQATATAKPTFYSSGLGTHSRARLAFDGGDWIGNDIANAVNQQTTIYVAVLFNSATSTHGLFALGESVTGFTDCIVPGAGDTSLSYRGSAASPKVQPIGALAAGTLYLIEICQNLKATTFRTVTSKATAASAIADPTAVNLAANLGVDYLRLGVNRGSQLNKFLNGSIGAFVRYDTALSKADRDSVFQALMDWFF